MIYKVLIFLVLILTISLLYINKNTITSNFTGGYDSPIKLDANGITDESSSLKVDVATPIEKKRVTFNDVNEIYLI